MNIMALSSVGSLWDNPRQTSAGGTPKPAMIWPGMLGISLLRENIVISLGSGAS